MVHTMEFIMDMVHHNPGEAPFSTAFLNPEKLAKYGYNAQVFKHINTAITFENYDPEIFPEGSAEKAWMDDFSKGIAEEIRKAKQAGLKVYYHIDLFVLPKRMVEKYKEEICNADGKIDLNKEKTLEIHRAMFDELFTRFSDVDGLIIRVGETYLHDTPYHTGNGAVAYGDKSAEKDAFVFLINFLRDEVCQKHGRYLFFRTWDCFPDRFHADKNYYLDVTDRIEPHEKLIFSIKHTALDFWRRVRFNDCLTAGKHRQIVEVQCQREYEGKGAYPMYVMDGVINAFEEYKTPRGLKDIKNHPLICGMYTWTRGGGWHGPYIKNEFWCDLNAYVIAQFSKDPSKGEEEIFYTYTREKMGLSQKDAEAFRSLCLLTQRGVLKGRYIESYDEDCLHERIVPCGNWMRDDKLGGLDQLKEAFAFLYDHQTIDKALDEKKEAMEIWQEAAALVRTIHFSDSKQAHYVDLSVRYGLCLFTIVYHGWQVMAEGYKGDKTGAYDHCLISEAIAAYDKAWEAYRELEKEEDCPSLYRNEYWDCPGLDTSVNRYRTKCEG